MTATAEKIVLRGKVVSRSINGVGIELTSEASGLPSSLDVTLFDVVSSGLGSVQPGQSVELTLYNSQKGGISVISGRRIKNNL